MKQAMKTDKAPQAIGQYSQGSRFGNIVFASGQLPVDLTRDFAKINEIYSGYFTESYPARSRVEASRLTRNVFIEIEAIEEAK